MMHHALIANACTHAASGMVELDGTQFCIKYILTGELIVSTAHTTVLLITAQLCGVYMCTAHTTVLLITAQLCGVYMCTAHTTVLLNTAQLCGVGCVHCLYN
jgi:hypothetical protein